MTIDEALVQVRLLPFSKRQAFYRGLETSVRLRVKQSVAWPDLLQFIEADDIDTAFKFVNQNELSSIDRYGLEEG